MHWTLSGVEVLIQIASYQQSVYVKLKGRGPGQTQIVGLEDQQDNSWNLT